MKGRTHGISRSRGCGGDDGAVTLVPKAPPGRGPSWSPRWRCSTRTGIRRPANRPAPRGWCAGRQPDPELSRRCYGLVGGPWSWVDRLCWSADDWRAWVGRPGHELWTLRGRARASRLLELSPEPDGVVETRVLRAGAGLEGAGLGGWMLTFPRSPGLAGTRRPVASGCTPAGWTARPRCPTTWPGGCACADRGPSTGWPPRSAR